MPKKKKVAKGDYKNYTTPGRIEGDGQSIVMPDGARFKRTVLPSPLLKNKTSVDVPPDLSEDDLHLSSNS